MTSLLSTTVNCLLPPRQGWSLASPSPTRDSMLRGLVSYRSREGHYWSCECTGAAALSWSNDRQHFAALLVLCPLRSLCLLFWDVPEPRRGLKSRFHVGLSTRQWLILNILIIMRLHINSHCHGRSSTLACRDLLSSTLYMKHILLSAILPLSIYIVSHFSLL